MTVHADIAPLVDAVNSVEQDGPPRIEELRSSFAGLCVLLGSGSDEVVVDQLQLGRSTVRRYELPRRGASGREGATPVLLWFHGGGWVIGSLDTHDGLCRELCARGNVTVISVEYRLAPEHEYPAAHLDALDVTEELFARAGELGIDAGAVAVGGDSAGANLAIAVAAAAARGELPQVLLQVLVYPVTDLAHPSSHRSRQENGEGFLLTDQTMTFFADTYAPDPVSRTSEWLSPLGSVDLSGRAPAVVVTAEYDPLRDEGEAFARRLADAGVPTEHRCVPGAVHLFLQMLGTAPAEQELELLARSIRSHLAR